MSRAPLILASASPRRKELLALTGLSFEVKPSRVDESLISGEAPRNYVLRLAKDKAEWQADKNRGAWILAADTIVTLNNSVIGKPRHKKEAVEMIRALSGRCHEVLTGYYLLNRDLGECGRGLSSTEVEFRTLTNREIEDYVDSGESLGKAGAYAIQGLGATLVTRVNGSYTNVIGLPLAEIIELMKRFDLII
ncbi:MAG: Maf family protein [Candidatus Adiutricales bacterium]